MLGNEALKGEPVMAADAGGPPRLFSVAFGPARLHWALAEYGFRMKRLTAITATVSIAGVFCVLAFTIAAYYYNRYRSARSELEERMNLLETRVNLYGRAHQFQDLVPCRIQGYMATAPTATEGNAANTFKVVATKSGPAINDRLYLAAGSTEKQEFKIETEREYGRYPVDAWVLHVEPPDGLAAFQEFLVYCTNHPKELRIVARPKANAVVKMNFTLVLLRGLE